MYRWSDILNRWFFVYKFLDVFYIGVCGYCVILIVYMEFIAIYFLNTFDIRLDLLTGTKESFIIYPASICKIPFRLCAIDPFLI